MGFPTDVTHNTVKNEDDCWTQVMTLYGPMNINTAIEQCTQTHSDLKVYFKALGKPIYILYNAHQIHIQVLKSCLPLPQFYGFHCFYEMSLSIKCPIYEMSFYLMSIKVVLSSFNILPDNHLPPDKQYF